MNTSSRKTALAVVSVLDIVMVEAQCSTMLIFGALLISLSSNCKARKGLAPLTSDLTCEIWLKSRKSLAKVRNDLATYRACARVIEHELFLYSL